MDGKARIPRQSSTRLWLSRLGWLASGMAVVAACVAGRAWMPAGNAEAKPPETKRGDIRRTSASEPAKTPPALPGRAGTASRKNPIAALVNNEEISREDLANECLLHYGAEVLETLVNRMLIETACQRRQIVIKPEQVDAEVERMARKFSFTKDQWLKTLEKERGIKPARYAQEIIWPTLALRELAKDRLTVSKQELEEAFESEFGPGVKVRLIALDNPQKAKEIHAQAVARPDEFPALAKRHSQDANSASAYGLIQPIRRHMGDPKLEAAAFALKKGEISPLVQVGNLHVFVKCEEHLPATKNVDRAKIDPMLVDALKERKMRNAANDVFKILQSEAQVENVYNNAERSKQLPGVAAVVNGQQLTIRQLAEECLDRHGKDVLEGTINRRLIDQALRKRNLKVGDDEIQAEIARAALAMGKVDDAGQPDVAGWLEYVTGAENISREVYVRDEVWPSAALKKLVGKNVQVTPEDLKRGYEANYGPKIQCRAIVLNNQRKAQEVWEQCRENPTSQFFGDLAEKHSLEAGSRSLRGEVPPIQKHGGQPLLEAEAFTLSKDNPLSGIVQVGNTFVILFYEGQTKPIDVTLAEVKGDLHRDILEKKMRLAMAKAFESLKDNSHVDNHLTGEIKMAKRAETPDAGDVVPGAALPKVMKAQSTSPHQPPSQGPMRR